MRDRPQTAGGETPDFTRLPRLQHFQIPAVPKPSSPKTSRLQKGTFPCWLDNYLRG